MPLVLRSLQALGFTPAQALVVGLLVYAISRMNFALVRLKLRADKLSRDRHRLHTYSVETRVRVESLERKLPDAPEPN